MTKRDLTLSLTLAAITWPLGFAFLAVLWVIGVPLTLCLALSKNTHLTLSPITNLFVLVWRPRWASLWSNWEDGVGGPDVVTNPRMERWLERWKDRPTWLRQWVWTAFRNPVSGQRITAPWALYLDESKITYAGAWNPRTEILLGENSAFTFARQGWKTGLWVAWGARPVEPGVWKHYEFRIGWRVYGDWFRERDRWVGMTLQAGKREVWR